MSDQRLLFIDTELQALASSRNLRKLPDDSSGLGLIDLCSNDYLGLNVEMETLTNEFLTTHHNLRFSSSASRLLSLYQDVYADFEAYLSGLYDNAALLFNSGYHANIGIVQALASSHTIFLCDKLIHASVIDGLRASGAAFDRFRHNDVAHLQALIRKHSPDYARLIIMTEAIFSMDGDMAPLDKLADLRLNDPKIILCVDEAHSVGVCGPSGLGLSMMLEPERRPDIILGTLGKACCSSGAYVICNSLLRDYLINRSRSLIFSTALPPVNVAWSHFLFKKITRMDERRQRLSEISTLMRDIIGPYSTQTVHSQSQIIPLITGDSAHAISISQKLAEAGILALAIRRPTVPPGSERIRFSLNASITDNQIEHLSKTLQSILK